LHRIAILGAYGTIGELIASRLVESGYSTLLVGRNPEKLNALASRLSQPSLTVDFLDSQALCDGLRQASESDGAFHGVVNCIGSILLKPGHLTRDAEFREVLETNLFTSFATIRAAVPLMREQGGSIVLFSSAAAQIGLANHEAIAAAKAGIVGLAKSAAATYAPNNIRINVVSPGLIKTELSKRIWSNPASLTASQQMHALQRVGEPHHAASLVTWLLDPANDWITGQVIGLDGGLGCLVPKK
jgi:NAD(P)-dependent dehydrogenase (short-subunit alcohol dehydrogenase family)